MSSEALGVVPFELGPTIDDLVELAQAAGLDSASRGTIRHLVAQGVVEHPRQQGRKWR